jgi:hypothetical protein
MQILKKTLTFISMSWKKKNLLLESIFYLGLARLLKCLPFSKVVPILGNHMEETTFKLTHSNIETLVEISAAIHIMSQYTVWESQCLVKAIAGMKMLEKRGIESTLYLGTAKNKHGKLVAHAWLRSGPFYIFGGEGIERFTVVSKFARKMSSWEIEGGNYG